MLLEKFGRYDDVDVNVLMSDEDKENLEPLSKREDRQGSLYCKSLPVWSTVTTIMYLVCPHTASGPVSSA